MLKWLRSIFKPSKPAEPVWLVDRDGRVRIPTRRVVLRAKV